MKTAAARLLPPLPMNWSVTPLRYASTCFDGKRVPLNVEERSSRRGDYPYWGANGVVDTIDEYLFDEPLVLLGEDGAPFFDKTKPVAFFVNAKIWVNNHIHVLRIAPDFDPRFVTYSLNATDYGPWIEGSTREKLTQDKMGSIPLPTPPLGRQRAIADYLDRETARIDALVAAKGRRAGAAGGEAAGADYPRRHPRPRSGCAAARLRAAVVGGGAGTLGNMESRPLCKGWKRVDPKS